MKAHNYAENRKSLTPKKALDFLKEGNKRFLNNLGHDHNHLEMVNITANEQFPFAAILSCSDSRTSAELIFDQGLGDVFSVRLAGNIASQNAIGSLEFSCKILGSKIIVVLGHTGCGAIKGACDKVEMGNLTSLLQQIYPAVENESETKHDRTSHNTVFVENVAAQNVHHQIDVILSQSSILRKMLDDQDIGIVGAIYDVNSGEVDFYDEDILFDLPEKYRSKL